MGFRGPSKPIFPYSKTDLNFLVVIALVDLIRDSIIVLKSFEECHISHIYRERNKIAEYFVKLGVSIPLLQWWDSHNPLPFDVNAIINHESQ